MKTEKRRIGYYYQPSGLINNVRMDFKEEDTGTILYGKIQKNEIILSKNKTSGLPLRVNATNNKGYLQKYINMRSLLKDTDVFKNAYVNVEKKRNVYHVTLCDNQNEFSSTKKNTEFSTGPKRKQGKVPRCNTTEKDVILNSCKHLYIPGFIWDKLLGQQVNPVLVYEEHYNPFYLVVKCVSEKQAENIPTIKEAKPYTFGIQMDKTVFSYKKQTGIQSRVYLSRFFMAEGNCQPGETFHIRLLNGELLIYKKEAEVCEVCGRPVYRHFQKVQRLDCCEECAVAANVVKSQMTGLAGERAEKIKKVFAETRELYKTLLEIKGEEK